MNTQQVRVVPKRRVDEIIEGFCKDINPSIVQGLTTTDLDFILEQAQKLEKSWLRKYHAERNQLVPIKMKMELYESKAVIYRLAINIINMYRKIDNKKRR